jgi:hypothetical protein
VISDTIPHLVHGNLLLADPGFMAVSTPMLTRTARICAAHASYCWQVKAAIPSEAVCSAKEKRRQSPARLNAVHLLLARVHLCSMMREPELHGTNFTLSVNAGVVVRLVL